MFSSLGEDALRFLADTVAMCEALTMMLCPLINSTSSCAVLFTTGEVVYNEGEMATYVFLVLRGM